MLSGRSKYAFVPLIFVLLLTTGPAFAQQPASPSGPPANPSGQPPATAPGQQPIPGLQPGETPPPMPTLGPNDTIPVPAYVYNHEFLPGRNLEYVWVTSKMTPAGRKRWEEWTRLRNAVYVTYPYARKAGIILNEMNAKMALMNSDGEKKAYIQSREKDLKKEFTEPLEKLSVYQGMILMKLINRQTGNNCYNIIKEYKGGFTARFWQTVAFFFGSTLKQPYDPQGEDRVVESIVQEVERMYHY
jgi:uncharacterized protein DUF4294